MTQITPILGVKEATRNIKDFLADNNNVFWFLVKKIMPWVIVLAAADTIITLLLYKEPNKTLSISNLLFGYFFSVLAISWHRVVIYGAEKAVAMNPFKPKKNELVFIGMGFLITGLTFLGGFISGFTLGFNQVIGIVLLITLLPLAVYLGYKFSFYFPAKATDNSITLGQSYRLTKGYFWKLMVTSFLASLKYILFFIAYTIISAVSVGIAITITGTTPETSPAIYHIIGFFFNLPIVLYFYPKFYVIGVTALSNYYLYAIQNKP